MPSLDSSSDYRAIHADVLMLTGAKSPAYFGRAIDALSTVLPHSRRIALDGLGHSGPDDDGHPDVVAPVLRDFFREA